MMDSRGPARWAVPGLFALAAAGTAAHAASRVDLALTHPGTRAWLVVLYDLLRTGVALAFAAFTVGRAAPRRPSRSPVAFLACAAAMAAVIAFGDPPAGTSEGLLLAGEALAVISCVWLLVSVLFLGRCFGVLPEARGLVRSGPYRFIRHPVYLGEIGACAGLALAAPSTPNAAALAVLIAAQLVRMRFEERALTAAFPDYAAYAAFTPRLLPRLALCGAGRIAEPAGVLPQRRHSLEPARTALGDRASRA
jgi:protein-S-isoprenylcysteine O-methyltransferase Ste14